MEPGKPASIARVCEVGYAPLQEAGTPFGS
jgi:hypothetical protein